MCAGSSIVCNAYYLMHINAFSDGMGRTGAFVCIDCELERLKNEGIVDIFQFVKSSRCCRPFLVENVVSRPTSAMIHDCSGYVFSFVFYFPSGAVCILS